MKVYSKPEFTVEEFRANDAIMGCQSNSSSTVTPINVDCLILSGTADNVFYEGCTFSAAQSGFVTLDADDYDDADGDFYEAKEYFWWYGDASGNPPAGGVYGSDSELHGYMWGNMLFNALTGVLTSAVSVFAKKPGGGSTGGGTETQQNYHAGVATREIVTAYNSSW